MKGRRCWNRCLMILASSKFPQGQWYLQLIARHLGSYTRTRSRIETFGDVSQGSVATEKGSNL